MKILSIFIVVLINLAEFEINKKKLKTSKHNDICESLTVYLKLFGETIPVASNFPW
jgi:hypothetical protein